ncbi:MAG: DEAD/DEAH box helicase, partial [Myxococcales bacterium]
RDAAALPLVLLAREAGEVDAPPRFRALVERLAPPGEEPAVPLGLNASLRPYQVEGFRWLSRMAGWQLGACLADDMGLGKTVQTLAMLLERGSRGPALVLAPTSVCFNWVREARRFAPELNPVLYRETDRDRVLEQLGPDDVLVASYGLLVRDVDRLSRVRFATLVLDEAQAVKNVTTQRTRAVRALDAEWRLALTGTPVENHVGELFSLFDILAPGLLGTREEFRERFAVPIARDGDVARRAALGQLVRPYVLRRTKGEVARDLPSRTEIQLAVSLGEEERALYEAVRRDALAHLDGGAERPDRFQVLAAITRLRQLACHPRLFDPSSALTSSKLERLVQLVEDLREGGHRALIFSQFTSHLALVREALDAREMRYQYLDGGTPEPERRRRVDA